jgi:hypothetical protein
MFLVFGFNEDLNETIEQREKLQHWSDLAPFKIYNMLVPKHFMQPNL